MTLVQIILLVGLLGALLMFVGDMVLYYNKNDYAADGTMAPIIEIMKEESRARLYMGGILGPISAFLYCIGYFHIVLLMDGKYVVVGWICFFVNCLGIICGGTYHSHCAYLGLIGRHEDKKIMDEVMHFLNVQKVVAFGIQAIGFIMLGVLIILGLTPIPRWMVVLTPGILVMWLPMMRKLPKGFHMIICGGWTNLISVIYYGAILLIVLKP